MKRNESIADRLIERELTSTSLEQRYKKEIEAMLERNLKSWERMSYVLGFFIGLLELLFFSYMTWSSWGKVPLISSLGFVSGAVFGLFFCVHTYRVLRKGRLHLKKDTSLMFGAVWIFVVIMMVVFLMVGTQMQDTEKGTQIILIGLVFFVMFGVVFSCQYNIQQASLQIRESVLKVELQLAELARNIETKEKSA